MRRDFGFSATEKEEKKKLKKFWIHLIRGLTPRMVPVVISESQYVQYLASKVLVVISEFVVVSESNWEGFVHFFFCVFFEVAIGNFLSSSLAL